MELKAYRDEQAAIVAAFEHDITLTKQLKLRITARNPDGSEKDITSETLSQREDFLLRMKRALEFIEGQMEKDGRL